MATVKTIKPDGTGDYTTLAAWEDFADGEATADQWAEVYAGASVGACALSGWAATPSGSAYPLIYAATSNGHGGRTGATAATTGRISITTIQPPSSQNNPRSERGANAESVPDLLMRFGRRRCSERPLILTLNVRWGVSIR